MLRVYTVSSSLGFALLLSACGVSQHQSPAEQAGKNDAAKRTTVAAEMAPAAAPAPMMMGDMKMEADQLMLQPHPSLSREQYAALPENALIATKHEPISTFSIDVDTAAYANVRRFVNNGQLPPVDAVRIEEMINYFDYDYSTPRDTTTPFKVTTELGPAPWSTNSQLLHIGIKGYEPTNSQVLPRNLVFLLDVSGSMNEPNKLPLVKQSLRLLVDQLNAKDTVSLVVYAGAAGVVLPPTSGADKNTILSALDNLSAGGSTNGAQGIQRAYDLARQHFKAEGVNRVILATDGDFNVGISNSEDLIELIKDQKKSGIGLTVLGVGMGNYNDAMLEQLSNRGDGNIAYIDTLQEARKVLVQDIHATLQTIARDTKIQLEFNPEQVASYRLIGYENRLLKQEDFTNDKVDAGDIGAGHRVTALYEINLKTTGRYESAKPVKSEELAYLKIRYKQPNEDKSREISQAILPSQLQTQLQATSNNYRFAAAVAGFGQILRHSKQIGDFSYRDVLNLARDSVGADSFGYRHEFIRLVDSAKSLGRHVQTDDVALGCCR